MVPGRQRHPAHVAHQGEAAVVDGQGHVFLLGAVADDERVAALSLWGELLGPRPDADADCGGDAGQDDDGNGELSDGHGVSSRKGV